MFWLKSLVLSLVFFGMSTFADVGKGEFESIRRVASYILSRYPSKEYLYVGIGRSPTPVMAYLETEGGVMVRNLPLTAFRYGVKSAPQLGPEEKTQLFLHFERFFPKTASLRGRNKILLIDFTFGGKTLASSEMYLEEYFRSCGIPIRVGTFGIAAESDVANLKQAFPHMDILGLKFDPADQFSIEKNDHLLMKMASKLYKDRSEYIAFDISRPTSIVSSRPEYHAYVSEMEEAKKHYRMGSLNDEWIKAYAELAKQTELVTPIKYFSEVSELKRLASELSQNKVSDEHFTKLVNEMISRIVQAKTSRKNECSEFFEKVPR